MDPTFVSKVLVPTIQQHMQQFDRLNAHVKAVAERASRGGVSFWEAIQTSLIAFDQKKGLPFRSAAIMLSDSPAAGTGGDTYRVSPSEDFIVDELFGSIVMESLPTEPAVAAALGTNIGVQDRIYGKAANARVKLYNKDTKVPYFESEANAGIPLSTICPAAGGKPMTFKRGDTPTFIVPANTTLALDISLASTNAMFTTAATEYGIVLVGAYVNRRYLGLAG